MGSFRTKASVSKAIGTLVPVERFDELRQTPDPDYPSPVASDFLAEGEWIKFRLILPLAVHNRVADEAAQPIVDQRGRVSGFKMKSGTTSQIKLEEGIVDFRLLDENGQATSFDPGNRPAMVEGVDEGVRTELLNRIGEGEMPSLSGPSEEDPRETVGNV